MDIFLLLSKTLPLLKTLVLPFLFLVRHPRYQLIGTKLDGLLPKPLDPFCPQFLLPTISSSPRDRFFKQSSRISFLIFSGYLFLNKCSSPFIKNISPPSTTLLATVFLVPVSLAALLLPVLNTHEKLIGSMVSFKVPSSL